MKAIGKALGTAAAWAGIAGLAYLFHSFGFLTPQGAGWMVFAGVVSTGAIWTGSL